MSKHKRKRFLSILITAVLVFTLALSSVMAQDDEHVRTDKLSVEGESVEVIEGVVGEDDVEIVEDEAITADDAEAEEADADEAADDEEIPAEDAVEDADADVSEAAEDDAEDDAGIMPLSVGDAEDEDDYGIQTLAGTATITVGDSGGDYSTFEDAISATMGSYDAINITLSSDVSEGINNNSSGTNGYIPFEEGITYTLDFNGHTINGNHNTHMKVFEGATLILTDSVGGGGINEAEDDGSSGGAIIVNGTLKMDNGAITNGITKKSGGAVSVESGGTFEMSGGTISGNSASNNGGGVFVDAGGSFTMSGGTITDNSISGNYGGAGVAVIGSSSTVETTVFTMNGGTISENKCGSSAQGAGIYSQYATLNLNKGEISGNTTTDKSGGGVYAYTNSVVTMEDGMSITDNHVTGNDAGGVIAYNCTFTMNGGTISNNTANSSGGVQVYGGSTVFNMNGGEITGNTADANKGSSSTDGEGGGVQVKVSGSSCIFNMTGGTISGNTAASAGGGIGFASGTVNVGGTATITGNVTSDGTTDNVHLYNNSTITLLGDDDAMSDGASIGVNTVTKPTESSAVQITSKESGTELYADALQYFSSDDLNYKVRTNDSGYLELYLFTFEADYLSDDGSTLYTAATADNYLQILSGKDAWDALTDEERAMVDADLTAANGGETLTYQMLLDQAQAIADEVNAFENSYLNGEGELYTSVDENNMADILAGASDWANMSAEAKAAVNADLTAANGGVELTYDDLLAQAFQLAYLTDENGDGPYTEVTADNMDQILSGAADWENMSDEAKAAVNAALTDANDGVEMTYDDLLAQAFQQKYLTDDSGNGPYTAATADNYEQILAGADDWDAMSEEAKEAVNKALQEASGDPDLDYPTLLAQAQAYSAAADFIYSYVSDSDADNPYLEATADNYEQILSGESDWDAMSEAEQAAVNAILTAANGGEELTYPMLLEQAKAQATAVEFEEKYLTGDDGALYTAATADNYAQILAGASDWAGMSDAEKAAVNADLTAANGGVPLTYDDLLAQAFELAYLTDDSGNGPYTTATPDNMDQILAGADDWNALSDEAKEAVNKALQEASGDSSLTYDGLLAAAFELKYLMGSDGNLYTEVTADNYLQILSGEADWNRLSPEAQALVNAHLTAANGGELLTYPMLLEQAKAFAASLGNVKTGDNTHLYLYVILAAAAAAAAAGAAVYRRRRI